MTKRKFEIIKDFIRFCKKELNIQSLPHIKFTEDPAFVLNNRSFGGYLAHENTIKVYTKGRVMADYLRSLAHELTHHRQLELNMLQIDSGETGSEIENEANAMAGILLREYGQLNSNIYELDYTQNLQEAKQVGTLYHFTSYKNLVKIIKNDFKLTSTIQPYVSFTRNKNLRTDTVPTQVRLTIDGDQMSNKYKITPYADTKAGYGRTSQDENEERISLEKYPEGIDVARYLVKVTIKKINTNFNFDDPDTFQDTDDFVEPPSLESYNEAISLLKKNGIPYEIVDKY